MKQKQHQFLFTDKNVDETVNSLLTAMTKQLGRPFTAGKARNVREVVKKFCPLSHTDSSVAMDGLEVSSFRLSYITSHFLDRYFYSEEVVSSKSRLQDEAIAKFMANVSLGTDMNSDIRSGRITSWLKKILNHAKKRS